MHQINEQMRSLSREIETIKKGQMEILEPKSMITNEQSLDQFNRRLQMAEERVIELENTQ